MTMKDGMLTILFSLFALVLISSKHTESEQSPWQESSVHISVGNISIEGVVPELNFSLKKVEVSCLLKFVQNKIFDVAEIQSSHCLSLTNVNQCRTKTVDIQHFKKKTFRPRIFDNTDKEDPYLLS